jgi:hypothetical protein
VTFRGKQAAPAYRAGWLRLLDWEEKDIRRIVAGEYGGDDALSPYQLWLKYRAEHIWRPTGKSPDLTGGQPYDPDARVSPWNPRTIVRAGETLTAPE